MSWIYTFFIWIVSQEGSSWNTGNSHLGNGLFPQEISVKSHFKHGTQSLCFRARCVDVCADDNAWAVHVSKICVTRLAVSKPSWDFRNLERSKNMLRGVTFGICLRSTLLPVICSRNKGIINASDGCSVNCSFQLSIILLYLHRLRVYYELTAWPAPSWLDSSVGRAVHRYRRCHGFKFHQVLNFFQVSISGLLKL